MPSAFQAPHRALPWATPGALVVHWSSGGPMHVLWLLLLLGGLACTYGAVVQRVTGPDESEITHASVGGGVNVYLTGSALGTPFNPRESPH